MRPRRIIGIAGQKENGKDTLAEILLPILRMGGSENWRKAALADPIKEIVSKTFGVSRDFIERWKGSDIPPPGWSRPMRELLKLIGDGFRDWREDVWHNYQLETNNYIVVPDIRYYKDFDAVRSLNGYMVLIYRPDKENKEDHRSESQVGEIAKDLYKRGVRGRVVHPRVNYFVVNDGTKLDLENLVIMDLRQELQEHFGDTFPH